MGLSASARQLVGALLVTLCAASAHAQPVVLKLAACPVPPPAEVRALVSLELKERLVGPQAAIPSTAQHVQLSCSEIQAEVVLRETGARRSLSLASVPGALRARLLALAIAELAREGGEPVVTPTAPPARPAASTQRGAQRERPSPHLRHLLSAGAELQATPLLGAGGVLSFLWRARPWLTLASSLSLGQARSSLDGGTLRVRELSLRTGPALTLQRGRVLLQLGLGARAGVRALRGEPKDAQSARAASFPSWYLAPAAFTGLLVLFGTRAFLGLELELAHTLRGVRAEVVGGEGRELSPLRSSVQLALGVAW